MQQKEKLNELIGAIHEKDELLDSQEEFVIKENKNHVKVKNAYAQEVEKNENLTKELSICHDAISNLRNENASLNAKVEHLNAFNDSIANLRNENANLITKIDKLNESISSLKNENTSLISKAKDLNVCNDSISCLRDENATLHAKIDELNACKPSTSIVDHVTICTRCRDVNVDVIHDHLALIKQQNDHIAQLTTKINEHEIENEKFKFARSMLYSGRRPGIKDGIVFQQGSNVKLNAPKRLSNFVKGKAPWFKIMKVTFYILLIILSTKLGDFMLRNIILFFAMLLCIRMRLPALGILLMLKCLKRKLLLHQMIITFHLRILMHHMFSYQIRQSSCQIC
jgi:ubiquinone biosynthesis protein UbiJ